MHSQSREYRELAESDNSNALREKLTIFIGIKLNIRERDTEYDNGFNRRFHLFNILIDRITRKYNEFK